MKRNNNKFGFSLAEISIAVLIFAVCAVPLYYAISYGSKEEIHLEKVAKANKILESFRDEIKNLDYDVAKTYMNISETSTPPDTFKALLEVQKKYKDFKFSTKGSDEKTENGISRINFKAQVKFTSGKGAESVQKISFVKVK